MANVIKLRKGLDINLKGKAKERKDVLGIKGEYALAPSSFIGVRPKVVVREGDNVKVGDPLFVNKDFEDVVFTSPVSGTVKEIVRGDRRKVLYVKVLASEVQEYKEFEVKGHSNFSDDELLTLLSSAGLLGYITQLPYGVSTNTSVKPKSIFVSAFRDMPLSADFEFELKGNENEFQTGLTALSRVAKTYLGVGRHQKSEALLGAKDVEVNIFDGPCPAGNASVQVNHLDPVNKGEIVWMVDPMVVIFIGRLLNKGTLDFTRLVAVAGSMINEPSYVETIVGTPLSVILKDRIVKEQHVRIIDGNPLTGVKSCEEGYLGAFSSEVTVIPEGDDNNEMFGWILPRFNQYSANRSYFSWLLGKKEYDLDSRIKGGERHMIMSGEYDKVLPMDIFGEYLIKAIIAEDIDKMEQLGIYEVTPQDFALAEFVDSSKLELQSIVRKGLDMLRKENA